jgi:hypothetical protein
MELNTGLWGKRLILQSINKNFLSIHIVNLNRTSYGFVKLMGWSVVILSYGLICEILSEKN